MDENGQEMDAAAADAMIAQYPGLAACVENLRAAERADLYKSGDRYQIRLNSSKEDKGDAFIIASTPEAGKDKGDFISKDNSQGSLSGVKQEQGQEQNTPSIQELTFFCETVIKGEVKGDEGKGQGQDQGKTGDQGVDQGKDQGKDQGQGQDQGKAGDQGQDQGKTGDQGQDQGKTGDQGADQGKDQGTVKEEHHGIYVVLLFTPDMPKDQDQGKADQGKDQGKTGDQGVDQGKDQGKDQGQGQDQGKTGDQGADQGKDQGKTGDQGQDQGKDQGQAKP